MTRLFERLTEVRRIDADFLHPDYAKLADPYLLPDMQKAVQRIRQAVKNREKVLIYGDYDVDGVTASVIMHDALKMAGITEVEIMLPDRFIDGYGMSERLVKNVKNSDFSLIFTVDCGSNDQQIIQKLTGVDVIVTDHHELAGRPPRAVAVINPKRTDKAAWTQLQKATTGVDNPKSSEAETSPSKQPYATEVASLRQLSGAGVAFILARALVKAGLIPDGQEKWLLDLAMIGTICDSMELTGDNRIICHYGLVVLAKTRRPGLKELMQRAQVRTFNSEAVGFQIGPRLNAAGRMETANLALQLLMAKSPVTAVQAAAELDHLNAARKKQQNTAVRGVAERGVGDEPVIVTSGPWHEGVLGIIAGRLTERYKRPSFVLAEVDGDWKGSGRSFGDFNLAEALNHCRDCLISGGGHAAACGVRVPYHQLAVFADKINAYYRSLGLKNQERYLEPQADLTVGQVSSLSLELLKELSQLEPYGNGNPEPVFLLKNLSVLEARTMGADGQHLRLLTRDAQGEMLKLVAFNAPTEWLELQPGGLVDAWLNIYGNEWHGTTTVEGRILKLEKHSML